MNTILVVLKALLAFEWCCVRMQILTGCVCVDRRMTTVMFSICDGVASFHKKSLIP